MNTDPVDALLAWSTEPQGPLEPTDNDAFAIPVFGRLFSSMGEASAAERTRAVERLAPAIGSATPYSAARIALVCGTLTEWGADPNAAGEAVVARLHEVLDAGPPADPTARRALRFLVLASMAMLCRSPSLRRAARARPGFASAVEAGAEHADEAGFVSSVLELVDDFPVVVIHPERNEGWRLQLEAVSTVFHLMTLLHDAFPEWCGEDTVDPEVAAIARGDVPGLQRVVDHARFHLFDYTGLAGDPSATLWGEASPTEIPEYEGVRYVVIAPPLFGNRSWDSGFFANFHDALRSRIHPSPLSPAELADVLARLPRS